MAPGIFMRVARLLILSVFALAQSAAAHEYWIDPVQYVVGKDEPVVADFRNGERFEGNRLAFMASRYTRHDLILGDARHAIDSDLGQRPAVSMLPESEGLGILVVESVTKRLRYATWEKFQKFIDHKAFGLTRDEHLANGFPEINFREAYRRYAKSLVGIGHAEGTDRLIGLDIELVALSNPYTDDVSGGLAVQAFASDVARASTQIELFEKSPDGNVVVTLHTTDTDGVAVLPVKRGHRYLVDTVELLPAPEDSEDGVVWETRWASLTFAVP